MDWPAAVAISSTVVSAAAVIVAAMLKNRPATPRIEYHDSSGNHAVEIAVLKESQQNLIGWLRRIETKMDRLSESLDNIRRGSTKRPGDSGILKP